MVLLAILFAVTGALVATLFGGIVVSIVVLVTSPSVILMMLASPWVAVRFPLAVPLTLARRRIVLRAAWRISAGRFRFLLGSYLMMLAMGMVALIPGLALQADDLRATMTAGSDPEAMARAVAAIMRQRAPWGSGRTIAIVLMATRLLMAIDTDARETRTGVRPAIG